MHCPHCGRRIASSALLCRRCLSQAQNPKPKESTSSSEPKGILHIYRQKALLSGRKTKVYVDKKLQGSIEDGDSITILIDAGEHMIHLETRIYPKNVLFGETRGITENVTIKQNSELTVLFSSTPFSWERHKILNVFEKEYIVSK